MSKSMEIEVGYDDGEKIVAVVRPKAVVEFEAAGHRMSMNEADGMSWIYKLAWYALGKPSGDFMSWLDSVEYCSTLSDDEEVEEDADGGPFIDG